MYKCKVVLKLRNNIENIEWCHWLAVLKYWEVFILRGLKITGTIIDYTHKHVVPTNVHVLINFSFYGTKEVHPSWKTVMKTQFFLAE